MLKRIVFLNTFFFLVLAGVSAQAAVTLSVTPVEGGNTLRFGRITDPARSNKEVRIRVTSDAAHQYQIFQRVLSPLVNERGEQLDRNVIQVSGLAGSNASGTIHVQGVDTVGYADQLVYTSSAEGTSDSFILIYQIDPSLVTKSGEFVGKILYTVRPLGGGSQDEVVLDLFLEASGEFSVKVDASQGLNRVRLDTLNGQNNAYVRFAFSENAGTIRIYQEMPQPLRNESFYEIRPEGLLAQGQSAQLNETKISSPTPLRAQEKLIYESDTPQDTVTVLYSLNPEEPDPRAGEYQGLVRYRVESNGKSRVFDIDMEVNVEPVFELKAKYPPEGMAFQRLLPGTPPQYKEISVTVHSNTGKPYFVSQNISALLTNEKGSQIPKEDFTVREELLPGATGNIEHPQFSVVQAGQTTLFHSDAQGSSAEFKVIYRLNPYRGLEAGDYQAAFVYTLGEM